MPDSSPPPDFNSLLDAHQQRLLAWLLAMTGELSEARDVLQQTNLVLWKKADQFVPGTSFTAWALRVAQFEVMSWRQRRARERLVFDEALLDGMAEALDEADPREESRHRALDHCLPRLPERQQEVVKRRYLLGERVEDIGVALGLPANAISQLLWRARRNLLDCINRTTGADTSPL